MKKIAIISSYVYDDTMTSMQCAYHTCYTYLDIEDRAIRSCSAYQCGSIESAMPNVEIEVVPITDELRKMYYDIKAENEEREAQKLLAEYTKEVEDYNKTLRPQQKGQIVEITEGKHKGKKGRIVWLGINSFKPSNRYSRYNRASSWRAAAILGIIGSRPYSIPAKDCDLVLVRPIQYGTTWEDGVEKVYIDIEKCHVIEGFNPLSVTIEDCRRQSQRNHENWTNLRDGYDTKVYI